MKTKNLLVGLAVGILGFFSNLNAQVTAPATLYTGTISSSAFVDSLTEAGTPKPSTIVDSVTVSSTMPYYVKGDPNIHMLRQWGAITARSTFGWTVNTANTNAVITQSSTSDSLVNVQWKTAGTYRLSALETPGAVASGYPSLCTPLSYGINVEVLNRPTAKWTATTPVLGGCNATGQTYDISVDFKGIGDWEISYIVKYYDLTNQERFVTGVTTNTAGDVVTHTAVKNSYGVIGDKNSASAKAIDILSITIPLTGTGAYGKYEVEITKVSDRISRKSGVNSIAADLPGSKFTIFSLPTPTTQPIQHIKNL